ncbi:hypothetical protein [Glycomyces buryatensis]|uniref:Serine peptidase n=1 Tax=Glycomyces buryatensis TaxID=2570927 RepID=A0A4V4HS08_9ACTN|nr:hypothetical protein [Glycomyces buryatensis]THV39786.1 hypothetical protein FAB82_16850 [Glycomyces buryatensis]
MIHIVGVHGVGAFAPGPAAATAHRIATAWKAALNASEHLPWPPAQVDLDIAYFAHLLQPPDKRREGERQRPREDDPDVAELVGEFLELLAPDPALVKGSWAPREAAAKLAELFGWNEDASLAFLRVFFPDVAAYMRDEGDFVPRGEVLDKVGSDLAGADIVIAHSLGSVVAYEALWHHRTDLPLLITIGSPLAMPMIFPHLTPEPVEGKGAKPPGVRRWVNIADHGDVVASPPGGISERFKGVDLDVEDDIDAPFFHDEVQYLQSRSLGRALADWNTGPTAAPQ